MEVNVTRSSLTRPGLIGLLLLMVVGLSPHHLAGQSGVGYVNNLANALGVPASDVFIKSATVGGTTYANGNFKYDDTAALADAMAALVSQYTLLDVPVTVTNGSRFMFVPAPVEFSAYITVAGVRQNPSLSGKISSGKTKTLSFRINSSAWNCPVVLVIERTMVFSRKTFQWPLPQGGLAVTLS